MRILAFEGLADAPFEVVVQDFRPNAAQGTRNGICEAQDIDAGAVVRNHLLKCARLTFDAAQAQDEFFLGLIGAAVRSGGMGIVFHVFRNRAISHVRSRQRFFPRRERVRANFAPGFDSFSAPKRFALKKSVPAAAKL